jgi:hypothetical protein
MSCLLRAYKCETPGCDNIITDHVTLRRRFCEECARKRNYESNTYYKYKRKLLEGDVKT